MEIPIMVTAAVRNATINRDGSVDVTLDISGTVSDKERTVTFSETRTITLTSMQRDRKFSTTAPPIDPRQQGKL